VMPAVITVLAQAPAPPGKGPEFGEASPIALVVTVLLAIAIVLLIRSMTKHLKRVPKNFGPAEEEPDEEPAGEPGEPAAGGSGREAGTGRRPEDAGSGREAGTGRRPEDAGGGRA
jgi:hypothetical protein